MTSHALSAADAATRIVAPLWPLKHFVAVNPFLGLSGKPFAEAAQEMDRLAGARMVMDRGFYAAAVAAGRIGEAELAEAAASHGIEGGVEALRAALTAEGAAPEPLATLADLAGRAAEVTERISIWAGGHFDEGQALWASPFRHLPPYEAWRAEAMRDSGPEIAGIAQFRARAADLPATADGLFEAAPARLGLEGEALETYLKRLVMSMPGWAGYARYKLWQAELHGGESDIARELLAVRLAWELILLPDIAAGEWDVARATYSLPASGDWRVELALQTAYEAAWQRDLTATFAQPAAPAEARPRPSVQAAFCIDVRSEVFRRALETVDPEAETIGFAGFFGAAITYVPLGREAGGDQCPVLLTPGATIHETARQGAAEHRAASLRASTAWRSFKQAAVASFGYVETLGLAFGAKMVGHSLGRMPTAPAPRDAGLTPDEARSLAPSIDAIPPETRAEMAATILTAMSMNGPFARIVMLAGHGSTSANNPHATGLDCGACGGHTGEANARVAAAILNDPAAREGLKAAGRALPEDTWFVPALHDTTTDEVHLYDLDRLPDGHADDIAALKANLAAAGRLCRAERAALLNLRDGDDADRSVVARARDWSQVRPEWGLAGCAAFIAAPRGRTAGRDLDGRAFLHSYDWRADDGFGVLELIMTAPLVVASWINLQYYGSTVDNRVFGSGNKVLHNVVGTIGVLEGNGGDLRPGLPMQSLHDGARWIHEPMRLNAVIEAPESAMNDVIARHDDLRALLDNGWLALFRMDEAGRIASRYEAGGNWTPVVAELGTPLAA